MRLVAEIYEVIKSGFKGRVQFTSQGRNNEPMVEVKLDKVEEYAAEIRKAIADKRKKEKLTGCLEKSLHHEQYQRWNQGEDPTRVVKVRIVHNGSRKNLADIQEIQKIS